MPYPISNVTRRVVYSGSAGTGPYSFSFEVLVNTDISVYKNTTLLTLTTDYSVTINSNGTGSVTLVSAATSSDNITLVGNRAIERATDFVTGGDLFANSLNNEFDSLVIFSQQVSEKADRGLKAPITDPTDVNMVLPAKASRKGKVLAFDSTTGDPVNGPTLDAMTTVIQQSANINTVANNITSVNTVAGNTTNINTVAGNSANVTTVAGISSNVTTVATNISSVNSAATNMSAIIAAPTQASNAASSATAAANSATAASNSAVAAAASAAAGMYSTVQDKSANYTIVADDAGDLIRVTTTSGNITITLPAISAVGDGFKVAVVKWTSDSNVVNINRVGSDTINGGVTSQIGSQYSQIIFVADLETSQWFASQTGLGATNVSVDVFSGNGSTTGFTLTADPGTKNNTDIYISGVHQDHSTYSISGTTLTFSTAPPTGTSNIEVVYSTPLAIGTPSDGTVTTSKIVDANVTNAKLANNAVTLTKLAREGTAGQILTSNGAGADPSYSNPPASGIKVFNYFSGTATISGTTLTVASVTDGILTVGSRVTTPNFAGTYTQSGNTMTVATSTAGAIGVNSTVTLNAAFTASRATNVMTVTAVASGGICVGMVVSGLGTVTALGTGTGGTGTYTMDTSGTVASGSRTGTATATVSALGTGAGGTGTYTISQSFTSTVAAAVTTSAGYTTNITAFGTGTGGAGTYTLSATSTMPSGTVTSNGGTFTIPANVTSVKTTVVGGGGNGVSYYTASYCGGPCVGTVNYTVGGGGGGAGGLAIKYLTGLTAGNTLNVTISGAGASSSVASGTQTISTITSTGGSNAVNATGGAGGTGSGGDINVQGSIGGNGWGTSNNVGWDYGYGSSSIFGGAPSQGNNATGYGCGGAGKTGGSLGKAGIVVFEW